MESLTHPQIPDKEPIGEREAIPHPIPPVNDADFSKSVQLHFLETANQTWRNGNAIRGLNGSSGIAYWPPNGLAGELARLAMRTTAPVGTSHSVVKCRTSWFGRYLQPVLAGAKTQKTTFIVVFPRCPAFDLHSPALIG